jgi:tripartite-type tricarboxylate transporter receptor subunit TctC
MTMRHRTLLLAITLTATATSMWCSGAAGQSYPTKTVRIVAPFAAGGPVDSLARLVAGRLTNMWGQQVVVDNRGGGNSVIGTEIVARSAPDGYTLLLNSTGFAVNATLYPKLPYDTVRDFAPIGALASGPGVLVVHPSFPARTLKQLIAMAKAKPGVYSYGSSGSGTVGHLTVEMLKTQAGIDLVHIPYKGAAPAVIDLIGGQIPIAAPNISAVLAHIRSGRVRALAVSSPKRWPSVPDIPTYSEAGLPGYEANNWYGMFAPAGTPPAIIAKINADTAAIMELPETRNTLEAAGVGPAKMSPEEFSAYIKSEIVRWGEAVKASGARAD